MVNTELKKKYKTNYFYSYHIWRCGRALYTIA